METYWLTAALFFYRELYNWLYTVPSHFEEYRKEPTWPMYRHDVIDVQDNEAKRCTCYFLMHVLQYLATRVILSCTCCI